MSVNRNKYLRKVDYDPIIRNEVLDVITDDVTVLDQAERRAIETVQSHLSPKYDTDKIFDLSGYSATQTFAIGDYIEYVEPAWVSSTVYTAGDIVSYSSSTGDLIYTAIASGSGNTPSTVASAWTQTAINNEIYTSLESQTGTKPSLTGSTWEQKDGRSQVILGLVVDLTLYELHSRINPRNIPEHRLVRWEEALGMLEKIQDNKVDLSLPRPTIPASGATQDGLSFRWGSTVKFDLGIDRNNIGTDPTRLK